MSLTQGTRLAFVHDCVYRILKTTLTKVPTKENVADALTKSLCKELFIKGRVGMTVKPTSVQGARELGLTHAVVTMV